MSNIKCNVTKGIFYCNTSISEISLDTCAKEKKATEATETKSLVSLSEKFDLDY
jgi:hypothetical protein